jgi:hypothetical protein
MYPVLGKHGKFPPDGVDMLAHFRVRVSVIFLEWFRILICMVSRFSIMYADIVEIPIWCMQRGTRLGTARHTHSERREMETHRRKLAWPSCEF